MNNNKFILVIFLAIIVFLLYSRKNNVTEEHFCADTLTRENHKFILWKGNKVLKYFNNYSDYLKYYHAAQFNFHTKCKKCKPLLPVSNSSLKTSNNAMDKNWADTTMSPKWFNIEYYENFASSDGEGFANIPDSKDDTHFKKNSQGVRCK